eukprot:1816863-Pleurochrysis_carterae.AAC.1
MPRRSRDRCAPRRVRAVPYGAPRPGLHRLLPEHARRHLWHVDLLAVGSASQRRDGVVGHA